MSRRISISDERTWKLERMKHLQASEAAPAINRSPWGNPDLIFDYKTGLRIAPDIGSRPSVKYGKDVEKYIRGIVQLDFPDVVISYHQYDILECTEPGYEFMGATLDGEIQGGDRGFGILEIKSGSFRSAYDLKKWDNQIPEQYYIQILHQLAVVDEAQYALVAARLKRDPFKDTDNGLPEIVWRYYRFVRNESLSEDITWLMGMEKDFWKCVKEGHRPVTSVMADLSDLSGIMNRDETGYEGIGPRGGQLW
jgi:predicted phage-related endonuclease